MVLNADGSIKSGNNEYAASHIEVAWAFMRRDYYPEVPHPLLQQSCEGFQAAYDAVERNVLSKVGGGNQRNADWTYRWPSLGFLKAPVSPAYVPPYKPYVPPTPPAVVLSSTGAAGPKPVSSSTGAAAPKPPTASSSTGAAQPPVDPNLAPVALSQPSGSGGCGSVGVGSFARHPNGTAIVGLPVSIRASGVDKSGVTYETSCSGVSKSTGQVLCSVSVPLLASWRMWAEFDGNSVFAPAKSNVGPLGIYRRVSTRAITYSGPVAVLNGEVFQVAATLPKPITLNDNFNGSVVLPTVVFTAGGASCAAQMAPVNATQPAGAYIAACSLAAPLSSSSFSVDAAFSHATICDMFSGSVSAVVRAINLEAMQKEVATSTSSDAAMQAAIAQLQAALAAVNQRLSALEQKTA
jgi:hypothetical protein